MVMALGKSFVSISIVLIQHILLYFHRMKYPMQNHCSSMPGKNKIHIFSIFLVQHGRKPVEALDMEREERLQQYGRVNGKPFELSQEIFISKTDCNVFSKIEKFVSKRSNLKKFWKQTAKVNLRYWLNCTLNGQWRMKYQTVRAKKLTRYLLNGKHR